jgi:hypothetical protein
MVFLRGVCRWLSQVAGDIIIKSDAKELKVQVMVFLARGVAYEHYL